MAAQYTERGVREISNGLDEARAVLRKRRNDLTLKLTAIQAEISQLNTIESALGGAVEVLASARKDAAA